MFQGERAEHRQMSKALDYGKGKAARVERRKRTINQGRVGVIRYSWYVVLRVADGRPRHGKGNGKERKGHLTTCTKTPVPTSRTRKRAPWGSPTADRRRAVGGVRRNRGVAETKESDWLSAAAFWWADGAVGELGSKGSAGRNTSQSRVEDISGASCGIGPRL